MNLEPLTPQASSTVTKWTCAMHPEIQRNAPGSCPICGMALEPKTVSLEAEENPELIYMTRRFKIGVTLVLLGQVLELRARSKTGAAIKALLGLAPQNTPPLCPSNANNHTQNVSSGIS